MVRSKQVPLLSQEIGVSLLIVDIIDDFHIEMKFLVDPLEKAIELFRTVSYYHSHISVFLSLQMGVWRIPF